LCIFFTTAILVQQAADTYTLVIGGISVNQVSNGEGIIFYKIEKRNLFNLNMKSGRIKIQHAIFFELVIFAVHKH
jgi:hypothetical protein